MTLPPFPPIPVDPPARAVLPVGARLRAGAVAGLVAAAATAGALVAFGVRDGSPMRAFLLLGRAVLAGAPAETATARQVAALIGVLAHVAAACAWGALLGALAAAQRGWRLATWAVGTALLAFLVQRVAAPALLRPGHEITALAPQTARIVLLYSLLAAGLAIGMRVAFRGVSLDERTHWPEQRPE